MSMNDFLELHDCLYFVLNGQNCSAILKGYIFHIVSSKQAYMFYNITGLLGVWTEPPRKGFGAKCGCHFQPNHYNSNALQVPSQAILGLRTRIGHFRLVLHQQYNNTYSSIFFFSNTIPILDFYKIQLKYQYKLWTFSEKFPAVPILLQY